MAAPILTMASVLAIRFKPCFHHRNGLNFITSIPNSKLVEDIYHQYHDKSDKTVEVIIQCSTEMTRTSSSLFDVEGGMSVGTLVRNFGIKLVEFTCNQKTTDAPSTSLEACAKEATEKAVDAFQLMMAGGRRRQGTETNDDNRPSLIAKQQKQQHKPSTHQPAAENLELDDRDPEMPTNVEPGLCSVQNARAVVNCTECQKPRVIYSKHKLSERQKVSLALSISEYIYSCGAPILPPSCSIYKTCMCRNNLSCQTPIETPYYGSDLGRKDLCSFCGVELCVADLELKKQYKTVLPCCEQCRGLEKKNSCYETIWKSKLRRLCFQ